MLSNYFMVQCMGQNMKWVDLAGPFKTKEDAQYRIDDEIRIDLTPPVRSYSYCIDERMPKPETYPTLKRGVKI